METLTARLLRIHGRVQGVGFREALRREAVRLDISGWVRNRQDGSVEALVCGTQTNIELIVIWAQHGPSHAMVEQVINVEASAVDTGAFEILISG